MAPVKAGKYEYRPESLVELRQLLELKQAKMAGLLEISANTLSRWETGATTPDAESLAAIHSIAMERGITPEFFQRRRPAPKPSRGRSRLLVIWDFQSMSTQPNRVQDFVTWIRSALDARLAPPSYQWFKAFAWKNQAAATDELLTLGWRIWEDDEDLGDEITVQAKSDCGQEPQDSVLVLITKDGKYENLVADLHGQGVLVYLITPSQSYSKGLVDAVGQQKWIQFPQHLGPLTFAIGPANLDQARW